MKATASSVQTLLSPSQLVLQLHLSCHACKSCCINSACLQQLLCRTFQQSALLCLALLQHLTSRFAGTRLCLQSPRVRGADCTFFSLGRSHTHQKSAYTQPTQQCHPLPWRRSVRRRPHVLHPLVFPAGAALWAQQAVALRSRAAGGCGSICCTSAWTGASRSS